MARRHSFPHQTQCEGAARTRRAAAGAKAAKTLRFATVAAKDWVAESLAGLKPVTAGRFIVHGAHDRAGIAPNRIGIEIEAALAFGTGHHGTTRGCLLALDRLCKSGAAARPRRAFSISAPAPACSPSPPRGALRQRVLATDIDAAAVRVARDNARLNRVGAAGRARHGERRHGAGDPRPRAVRSGLRQYPARAAAAPGRAAGQDRRARRPRRAVRPSACAGQCRARRLSRVPRSNGGSSSTAGRRWCSSAADKPLAPLPAAGGAIHKLPRCSRRISSRSRIAASAATARRGSRRCGRSSSGAASTVSSCRAPTVTRTNMCRPAPSGSPGSPASPARPALAIVLADRAVIFVDGRYTVQVRDEVDASAFTVEHLVEHPPAAVDRGESAGRRQARLFAVAAYGRWRRAARQSLRSGRRQASLPSPTIRSMPAGHDRPPPPLGAVVLHDLRYAGEDATAKLARVRADLEKITADALVVSDPQAVSLAVQHPRQRRAAHAGGARLRAWCRRRAGRRSISTAASSATTSGIASKNSPMIRARTISSAILPRSAKRNARCGSIRPPVRRRSRGSSPRTAARSCAAAIRSCR